ncbi:MAG: hypothetical protein J0L80_02675 [Chitinophagales bacterium]|nr:hypothetical protein [Chitinophagales bacterium]
MNRIKVFIEKWKAEFNIEKTATTAIAVLSFIISVYTICQSQKQFTRNIRPFVWAASYSFHGPNGLQNIPHRLAYRVKNAPARILSVNVKFMLNDVELFAFPDSNVVRYPDETSEWSHGLNQHTFNQIMNRPIAEQQNLRRIVDIAYQSLDGGDTYTFNMVQGYVPADSQWRDIDVKAN